MCVWLTKLQHTLPPGLNLQWAVFKKEKKGELYVAFLSHTGFSGYSEGYI